MTHFSPIPKKLEIAGVRFSICNKSTRIEVVFLAESLVFNQFTLRFYCWKFIFDKNYCFLIFILECGCYNHKFLRGLGFWLVYCVSYLTIFPWNCKFDWWWRSVILAYQQSLLSLHQSLELHLYFGSLVRNKGPLVFSLNIVF